MSKDAPASLPKRMYPHRFTILLMILVVNLLFAPILGGVSVVRDPVLDGGLALVVFLALLLSGVFAVRPKRGTRIVAITLGAAAVIAAAADYTTESRAALMAHHSTDAIFLCFVSCLLLQHVFTQSRVTLNLINAALCAYLIVGLMFAAGFALIDTVQPGSFNVPDDGIGAFAPPGYNLEAAARQIYFSFVTMLTLGYGDIYPLSSTARIAAVMEAFIGQIIMVVLVARLVGVHVAQSFESPQGPAE